MPPKRTESRQKSIEKDGKILLALQAIHNGQIKSISVAATQFSISRSTLGNRAKGMISCVDIRANGHKLT
jgi:hypothetical protein